MITETRVRVRYAETDKMGVVYHANFIVWFEVGRVEMLRQMGYRYRDLEREHDCHIAVVDVRCRYKSPAYYDDEIVVRTRLKNVRGSLLHFVYEIVRAGCLDIYKRHSKPPCAKDERRPGIRDFRTMKALNTTIATGSLQGCSLP